MSTNAEPQHQIRPQPQPQPQRQRRSPVRVRSQPPRPLPESAVPEGCPAWRGEKANAWAKARPPVWVPVRTRALHLLAVVPGSLIVGFWLVNFKEVPAAFAALLPLQLVWTLVRPEVVRFSAPSLMLLLAWYGGTHDVPTLVGLLAVTATWAMAEIRLSSRRTQRSWAMSIAGGETAVVPDEAGPLRRGRFLVGLGFLLSVLGVGLIALTAGWDAATDRREQTLLGWFVIGCGFTTLLSGVLGRRRAAALRRAPVPAFRVLVRDGADGDAEVFAAEDTEAARPLFTVAIEEWYEESDDEVEERIGREELDEALDTAEKAAENHDQIYDEDDEEPGPLREAVLYGAPYEGAEVVIVSAAERPTEDQSEKPAGRPGAGAEEADGAGDGSGAELVVESSTGPVRPLSERAVRRRAATARARAARHTVHEELRATAVTESRARLGKEAVRRWRAGWADWCAAFFLALGAVALGLYPDGSWLRIPGGVLGLFLVLGLPQMLTWRITADRSGLWLNDQRRTWHIEWDDLMTVRCTGPVLMVDSHQASFPTWTVRAERWRWLERKLRLVHPYERTAAEITAMWQDPALRPTEEYDAAGRGWPLWPLSVVLAVAWVVALLLVP
ncbi:hypothetical protein ACWD26_09805 [Streptomyces sp. NPDC002787]